MPKLAATLASLLLIASSIGVNIARYPQVGHMMDPAAAGAAETASPLQPASEAPQVEKADTEQLPAKSEVAASAAGETRPGTGVAGGEPHADRMVAATPQAMALPVGGNVPIVDVRPMATVGENESKTSDSAVSQRLVQRLPTVDSGHPNPFGVDTADDGRNYPSTTTP